MSTFLETREGRRASARATPEARDFLGTHRDGFTVVSSRSGDRGGMVAHRGVLHPDEYVDPVAVVAAVEHHLGFTVEQMRSLYRQGPKSAAQRELRARIDARLLRVANGGGNMEALADVIGIKRQTLGLALRRAREFRAEHERLRRQHKNLRKRHKHALANRDGGARCRYCGQREKLRLLTIDHVIPLSRGGTNALKNLVLACSPCNHAKGDLVA